MMKEQEKDQLNLSSAHISLKPNSNTITPPTPETSKSPQRVRHVYLEQQNVYGRFIPFLLLKDQLHSQIDSSGSSALVHMCSHNSPYIPLYLSTLKQDDPILNRPTNLGHTPIDVAGMYCKRQYIDLLKNKGAIDEGKVDSWAIQGANIANWSGQVDVSKKALIHWAAYNNLPDVLKKYVQEGANVNEPDQNGNTPIDMAIINKNYQSVEVLAQLGYRPKKELLDKAQSPYLNQFFMEIDRPPHIKNIIKSLKLSFIPLVLLSQYFINTDPNVILSLLVTAFWLYLVAKIPQPDSTDRPTSFFSELLNRQINYASNHKAYVVLLLLFILTSLQCLIQLDVNGFMTALYFWILLAITLTFSVNLATQLYGIFTNTTPNQLLESHKHPKLWQKIDYIVHRNMLVRVYHNPNRKDYQSNLQAYLSY